MNHNTPKLYFVRPLLASQRTADHALEHRRGPLLRAVRLIPRRDAGVVGNELKRGSRAKNAGTRNLKLRPRAHHIHMHEHVGMDTDGSSLERLDAESTIYRFQRRRKRANEAKHELGLRAANPNIRHHPVARERGRARSPNEFAHMVNCLLQSILVRARLDDGNDRLGLFKLQLFLISQ